MSGKLLRMEFGVLLLVFLAVPALDARQSPVTAPKDPKLAKLRSMAATQHEIVILLLEKKEFTKALAEASKIFSMKWPEDQEPLLLHELLFFTDQFLHHEQPAYGLRLLDSCARSFPSTVSLIAIWKEKGFLHKKMNQTDKALECFREAQRLEQTLK